MARPAQRFDVERILNAHVPQGYEQYSAASPPPQQASSSQRGHGQDARLTMHGARSTFLAGLLPSRRVSPSPCCHSPALTRGVLAPRSNGNTRASCAPHLASGVEGVRVWGDALSFWVGRTTVVNMVLRHVGQCILAKASAEAMHIHGIYRADI